MAVMVQIRNVPEDLKTARRGDRVVYNFKIFLNRGDEIPLNAIQSQALPRA